MDGHEVRQALEDMSSAPARSDGWGLKVGGLGWNLLRGVLVLGELERAGM